MLQFNTKVKVNVSVAKGDRIYNSIADAGFAKGDRMYNSVTDVGFISSQYSK